VVALIVPNWQALSSLEGISGRPDDLVRDERVRAVIQRRVDQLNRELGSWEMIKHFELLPRDLSEQGGELTPTLKVKRRVVQERYRDQIETMYQDKVRPPTAAH